MTARILIFALLSSLCAKTAAAQSTSQDNLSWPKRKCALYQRAWDSALAAVDSARISVEFRLRNQEFIGSGCSIRVKVCPRSAAEFDMANMLTVMTMSEGMASTFVPFHCTD